MSLVLSLASGVNHLAGFHFIGEIIRENFRATFVDHCLFSEAMFSDYCVGHLKHQHIRLGNKLWLLCQLWLCLVFGQVAISSNGPLTISEAS